MENNSFSKIIMDSDSIPDNFEDHLIIAPDYDPDRGSCYILPGYESPSQYAWFEAHSVAIESVGNRSRNANRKAHSVVIPPEVYLPPHAFDRPPAGTLVLSYVVSCYSCGKFIFIVATKDEDAQKLLKTEKGWRRIVEDVSDDCRSADLEGYQGLWLCPKCYLKLSFKELS